MFCDLFRSGVCIDLLRDLLLLFLLPLLVCLAFLVYKALSPFKPRLRSHSLLSPGSSTSLSLVLYSNIRSIPLFAYVFFSLLSSPSFSGFLLYELDSLFPSVSAIDIERQVETPVLSPLSESEFYDPELRSWVSYYQDLMAWVFYFWYPPSPRPDALASGSVMGVEPVGTSGSSPESTRNQIHLRGLTSPVRPPHLDRELASLTGHNELLTSLTGAVDNSSLGQAQHTDTTSAKKPRIPNRISCCKLSLPD